MSTQQKKRVLIIANELSPYLELTDFSAILNKLAVKTFDSGIEVRVIMPRFGTINERRHRLHEVVRLSGINVVVDKEDHPLLIKVASLPNARLQVYFMDNEDFFKRKYTFNDAEGNFFEDNAERLIFFGKSALEIVKKFGWPPDIIHCHGWMTSLVPLFLKTSYKKEPVFANSKVIYTAQKEQFENILNPDFGKMLLNSVAVKDKDVDIYNNGTNLALNLGACKYADAILHGELDLNPEVGSITGTKTKQVIPYDEAWKDDINPLYSIYQNLSLV